MALRVWLASLLLTVVAPLARAQDQAGWAYKLFADKNGKAVMEHDFGTVPKGAMLQHRFPLTNMYSVPLTIQTRVSCDCVTVAMSKQTLQSRETGYMDVQMDTRRFNGHKVVTIFFTVLHPQYTSTALVNVRAVCRTDVTLNPGGVNFGIVPRGESRQAALDVDYAGMANWQVTGANKSELFEVGYVEKYRQPGRSGYRVTLTLKPDAPAGSYKQELMLSTNDPAGPTVPVPFEVTVQAPLVVSPDTVRFSSAKVGSTATHRVVLHGSGKSIKLTGVEGLGDGLEIVEAIPSADSRPVHPLTLKWTPTAAGELNRKVVLKTDAGTSVTLTVEGSASP